jgi:hypothetical protein
VAGAFRPVTLAEPVAGEPPEPMAVVAVEARAAVPATFANVRLDIFLVI